MNPHEPRAHNYILCSDIHLGADLVQHARPGTASKLDTAARVDADLCQMLDFYLEQHDPERPWRLIVAGDLVDFIGMSIAPSAELLAELTAEERRHGLGSTAAQGAAKMRAVIRRHCQLFAKLADFLARGHSVVLVHGNHDVDFHWEDVRLAFIEALLVDVVGEEAQREAASRVEFHPWFFYEEGLLYVEHGHQFDAMCSYHHLLCPVSPRDPQRISWSFADILLREVVQPTHGVTSEGHDSLGMFDYIRLAFSLGPIGGLVLGRRYVTAIFRALRRWQAHLGTKARALKEEHDRRVAELAERTRLGLDRLRALAALWPRPITRGPLAVLRSMFFDQILLFGTIALALPVLFFLLPFESWIPIECLLIAGGLTFFLASRRLRGRDVDPAAAMRHAAKRIAELVQTRFVVMGHTHEPVLDAAESGSTYVNLGSWAVDELEEHPAEASRTHLVLRWVDGELKAQFMRWIPSRGPELVDP